MSLTLPCASCARICKQFVLESSCGGCCVCWNWHVINGLIFLCWSLSFVVVSHRCCPITILFRMLRCGTSLSRRALLPSTRFIVCIRHISKVNQPQYPSPRDQELVNKYFYDVTVEGAKSELEDAMKVNSPVLHLLCNLLVV